MAELAVITGASSGIGAAYAQRLAQDGWDLVIVARRRDRLEALADRLARECGVAVQAIDADLAAAADLQRVCEAIADRPVDMLINNAALAHYMEFSELPAERATELVHLNVLAPVLLSRAVIPGMRERGKGVIVNVASLLAFSGTMEAPHMPKRAVYAASKSFLVTFSQALAAEVRDHGIRVQVVCPGVVDSEFHTRQNMDMSGVPRMEPRAVVTASLADLDSGDVICVPGLPDVAALGRLVTAQNELLGSARTADLPERYRGNTQAVKRAP